MPKRFADPLKEPSWGRVLGVSAVLVIVLVVLIKIW